LTRASSSKSRVKAEGKGQKAEVRNALANGIHFFVSVSPEKKVDAFGHVPDFCLFCPLPFALISLIRPESDKLGRWVMRAKA
jgi:hypothetical protein